MQKRKGRSCGKIPVSLTSGACATIIALRVVVSALFVSVESIHGGERESDTAIVSTVNDLLSSFLFFVICSLIPSPQAFCRHLLPNLRVVFVLN